MVLTIYIIGVLLVWWFAPRIMYASYTDNSYLAANVFFFGLLWPITVTIFLLIHGFDKFVSWRIKNNEHRA